MGDTAPKAQVFNLKEAETQTLNILQSSHQRSFAATLSMLATERMGYKVTERTQFKLNADMTEMEITELAEEVPVANAAEPEKSDGDEPKTGVVTA